MNTKIVNIFGFHKILTHHFIEKFFVEKFFQKLLFSRRWLEV